MLKLRVVGRGISQPFEMFLQRPDVMERLRNMGYALEEIRANRLIMVNGVFTGEFEGPIVINKNEFVPAEGRLFIGDARDVMYNLPFFINVNAGNLAEQVNGVLERMAKEQIKDFAMTAKKGGIDLNAMNTYLQTKYESGEIRFNIDPAMLKLLQDVLGFTPVIINIRPMQDIRLFLGLKDSKATNSTI